MATPVRPLVQRRVLAVALARMAESPVVLLEGPRTVGKSTLLRALAGQTGGALLDLDDPLTRDAVATDPATFLAHTDGPVFIDEYQRAPIVLDAIKAELNRDTRPGRYVLTGSTRHDALPAAAQSLTGRVSRIAVHPFAQVEIDGTRADLLDGLFRDPAATVAAVPTSATTREDYVARIVAGGFPLARTQAAAARGRWFDEYVALTLERDVREISRVRQAPLLAALLNRLAGQTAQVLNVERAARDVGLDPTTAERYLRLLEAVFLVHRLPAWGKTLNSRASAAPKLHVLDSGLAARLLRLTVDKLARRDPSALSELGHLLETFAVGEIQRQAGWTDDVVATGHWRTHDDDEVDIVLERDDGAILAFEVKAAARVPGEAFRALRKLRTAAGDAFLAGVALYLGDRSYNFEDRLHVLPLDRLWVPQAPRRQPSSGYVR